MLRRKEKGWQEEINRSIRAYQYKVSSFLYVYKNNKFIYNILIEY